MKYLRIGNMKKKRSSRYKAAYEKCKVLALVSFGRRPFVVTLTQFFIENVSKRNKIENTALAIGKTKHNHSTKHAYIIKNCKKDEKN